MYKYIPVDIKYNLTESSQTSSIRYKLLLEDVDSTTLTEASAWFKCTDYMNDVVFATQLGKFFIAHGFDNKDKIVRGDVFLAIKDYSKFFTDNLVVANKWLEKQGYTEFVEIITKEVENVPKGLKILRIPRTYLANTFHISLIMLLIRGCTWEISDEEELFRWDAKAICVRESSFFGKAVLAKNKPFFDENVFLFAYNTWNYDKNKYDPVVLYNKNNLPSHLIGEHWHNIGCYTTLKSIGMVPELQEKV